MNLVVVESPAKAKTINKYLGDDYIVLASYGHIRDLPSKNGSVDPENNFKMEWEVDSFSKKYLKEITDAAKISSKIILATDPDREGEAIAWHVREFSESLIPDSQTYIGQGDLDSTSGAGADIRFDFASMGILPDGGSFIAYHDSSDPDPLFAVEMLLPSNYQDNMM